MKQINKTKRYYLHGDRSEENPELYFCKACDFLAEANHFQNQCRCKDHLGLYKTHLKNFQASVNAGSDAERPLNPDNLFT